jgi:hypothetical protein
LLPPAAATPRPPDKFPKKIKIGERKEEKKMKTLNKTPFLPLYSHARRDAGCPFPGK